MAFKIGDWFENTNTSGIIAGVGAIVLAPIVIPVVAKASKPIAKAVIKGGILAYDKSKTFMAETGEVLEDLVAEVQAEIASEEDQENFG
jgi:hypothetical protein